MFLDCFESMKNFDQYIFLMRNWVNALLLSRYRLGQNNLLLLGYEFFGRYSKSIAIPRQKEDLCFLRWSSQPLWCFSVGSRPSLSHMSEHLLSVYSPGKRVPHCSIQRPSSRTFLRRSSSLLFQRTVDTLSPLEWRATFHGNLKKWNLNVTNFVHTEYK